MKILKMALAAVIAVILCGAAVFVWAEAQVISWSKGNAQAGADYLIVLGAKVNEDGPSVALSDRLGKALEYLQDNPDCVAVVTGGRGEDEPFSEASCMAEWLTQRGIDPQRILTEDNASDTRENLRFSCELIGDDWSDKKIAVVSSEYHLCRAHLLGESLLDYDFQMLAAPTSLLPYKIYYFYREALGIVYTRLFYI